MESSLYIHIPYCISKCLYCDFYSIPHTKVPDSYIKAICNEIRYRTRFYKSDIKTVYIGGGTPSLLSIKQLKQVLENIENNCNLSDDAEITIEVNPDDVSDDFLEFLSESIVNRISCGIQSMNDDSLRYVKRRGNRNDNLSALDRISRLWNKSFSVDLICGLPFEDEYSFLNSLNEVISYGPDHISMYSLTIEEETPLGKLFDDGKLEYNFEEADDLWIKGRSVLKANGYIQYEVSNFSKAGQESKHNLTYWNHENYLGCGSGGTGTVYGGDGSGDRWTNTKNIEEYIDFWNSDSVIHEQIPCANEKIDVETSKFEFFMMGLRKLSGISEIQYKNIFGRKFTEDLIELSEKWKKNRLCNISVSKNDISISLNEQGILFLNRFLEELLEINL